MGEYVEIKSILTAMCEMREAGLIFITSEDPVSRMIRSITKQEYSSYGFYLTSNMNSNPKILVFLVDMWDKLNNNISTDLSSLVGNKLITKISLKPLNPTQDKEQTKKMYVNFRAAILSVISDYKKPSISDIILDIFGYDTAKTISSDKLVDQVLRKCGLGDTISTSNHLSTEAMEELKRSAQLEEVDDAQSKVNVLTALGYQFTRPPKENVKYIQSYLNDTSLFGPLVKLALPLRTPQEIEQEKANALITYRPFLVDAIATFIDLMLTRPDFFSLVVKSLNYGRMLSDTREKTIWNVMVAILKDDEDLIKFIDKCMKTGIIDSAYACALVDRLNENRATTSLLLGYDPEHLQFDSQQECPQPCPIPVTVNGMHKPVAINQLYTFVDEIISNLKTNPAAPVKVDLMRLVSIVNDLTKSSEYKELKVDPECVDRSFGGLIITGNLNQQNPDLNITLKDGHTIILPSNGATDFSHLEKEILIEIEELLDRYAEVSNNYDLLRLSIAKEINMRNKN